jgi:dihydroflavonol-4-reductase
MKALVTGATGFVGSHLVEVLQSRSIEVTALARSAAKAADLVRRGVRVVSGDLDQLAGLDAAVRDQDVVYHVAGMVAARNEAEFLHCNRDGTRNLLAAAERQGKPRFILVSSLAAAGPAQRGSPLLAAESPRPVTAYGRSKLAAEEAVRSSALPWSVVRPPIVYGPRDREVLKMFLLAKLGLAPVFGDGGQELSAVHAADLAQALAGVGQSPEAIGETYHACHPQVFSSSDLALAVAAAMGRSVLRVRVPHVVGRALLAITERTARLSGQATILTRDKANEFFQPAWTGDPGSLIRDTGWHPRYDLSSGLADTYQWYRTAGWL